MGEKLYREGRNLFFMLTGSLIMAAAYAMFLIPFHIVPGGVSGLAIIFNYLSGAPVGLTSIVLNIPIFYLGFRFLGKLYGIRSILGMIFSFLTIDLLHEIVKLPQATGNLLLASIYGGIIMGLGLGLVLKGRATTGGTDILGLIINKYTGVSVGVGIFLVDFFIISLSGIVYKSLEYPLLGYLTLFLSSKSIDFVLEGWSYAKLVLIVSEKEKEIKQFILNEMNRSGTYLYGQTFFLEKPKKVIMTVISTKEFPILRQAVKRIDPKAFMIVTEVYEVVGKGFRPRSL